MDRQTRAYAIFVSTLETGSWPAPREVREAVAGALRRHRDARGCVAAAAHTFGAHPQAAARRMRWALALVAYRVGCTTRVPPANDDATALRRDTVMATL